MLDSPSVFRSNGLTPSELVQMAITLESAARILYRRRGNPQSRALLAQTIRTIRNLRAGE